MEEKSSKKFFVIGAVAAAVIGSIIYAQSTFQTAVRITPKEGDRMAEAFADDKLESATVAPLPGAAADNDDNPSDLTRKTRRKSLPALTVEQYKMSTNYWLTGRVVLQGKPPAEKPLPLDPECKADAKANNSPPAMTRNFVVGADGALANVVVSVANPPGAMEGHFLEPHTIHIRGCQIHPYVSAVLTGRPVMVKSHDSDFHDIRGYPTNMPNSTISFALLPGAPPPAVTFSTDEDFINLHTRQRKWIKGYLSIFSHPFFAVTDADGKFRIPLPPVDNVKVRAFHPLLSPVTNSVAVPKRMDMKLDLVLKYQPPAKEAAQ